MDRFEKYERYFQGGVAALMMAAIAIIMAGFLLLALTVSANAQTAEELFRQGLTMERSMGDYAAAIELYEQVAESSTAERTLVARALVQLGKAFESLGRTEAGSAYERVVAEFSDLDDLVAEARAGIRRIGSTETSTSILDKEPFSVTTLDLLHELDSFGSALSPSGRYFAAVDSSGSVVHVDLDTRERRTLVEGTWERLEDGTEVSGVGQWVQYSPDETEVAYGWWEDWRGYVGVVNVETGATRTLLDVSEYFTRHHDKNYDVKSSDALVLDWTKDGSAILAFVNLTKNEVDPDDLWRPLLLMVPLDGSTPRVIAKDDEIERWAWNGACLAGSDDQYVMTEFGTHDGVWIQRINVKTGEQVPWRKDDNININSVACPAGEDKVVYVSEYLSTPYLKAGSVEEIASAKTDDLITSLDSDRYQIAGFSDKGDLLIDSRHNALPKQIAMDVNPETGSLLGTATILEDGGSTRSAWDPSGTRFSWSTFLEQEIKIWDRTTGQTQVLEIEGPARWMKWFPDGSKIGFWGADKPLEFAFSTIDIETGEQSKSILVKGSIINEIGADGNSLLVSNYFQPGPCIERFDLTTLKRSSYFCLEDESKTISGFSESPDHSKYLYFSGAEDTVTIGVVDADGSNQRVVYEPANSIEAMSWIKWYSSNHVTFATRKSPNAQKADAVFKVDIGTREVTPLFESIFSGMTVSDYNVSPDGKTVVFRAKPKQKVESPELFIMHKVLGDPDEE